MVWVEAGLGLVWEGAGLGLVWEGARLLFIVLERGEGRKLLCSVLVGMLCRGLSGVGLLSPLSSLSSCRPASRARQEDSNCPVCGCCWPSLARAWPRSWLVLQLLLLTNTASADYADPR